MGKGEHILDRVCCDNTQVQVYGQILPAMSLIYPSLDHQSLHQAKPASAEAGFFISGRWAAMIGLLPWEPPSHRPAMNLFALGFGDRPRHSSTVCESGGTVNMDGSVVIMGFSPLAPLISLVISKCDHLLNYLIVVIVIKS